MYILVCYMKDSGGMEKRYLILLGWFERGLMEREIMPEIERNCRERGVFSQRAYEIYQRCKWAENSLYFHHSYAGYDIPIGETYEAIALIDENQKIWPESVQRCQAEILCFFTAYRTMPSEQAMKGHHELSLIQFKEGIPGLIIRELFQIERLEPMGLNHKRIILGTEEELLKMAKKPGKFFE